MINGHFTPKELQKEKQNTYECFFHTKSEMNMSQASVRKCKFTPGITIFKEKQVQHSHFNNKIH